MASEAVESHVGLVVARHAVLANILKIVIDKIIGSLTKEPSCEEIRPRRGNVWEHVRVSFNFALQECKESIDFLGVAGQLGRWVANAVEVGAHGWNPIVLIICTLALGLVVDIEKGLVVVVAELVDDQGFESPTGSYDIAIEGYTANGTDVWVHLVEVDKDAADKTKGRCFLF